MFSSAVRTFIIVVAFFATTPFLFSQNNRIDSFLTPSQRFNTTRFWTFTGSTAAVYSFGLIRLNSVWYSKFEQAPFHLFNDWGEWEHMDKYSHAFTAYFEASIMADGLRWSGVSRKKAAWGGFIAASVFQGAFELLDGKSKKWGFSIPDIVANEAGALMFAGQEWMWNEQRFLLKMSSQPKSYSTDYIPSTSSSNRITYQQRAEELYGKKFTETFFKDYNASTVWLSLNPASFCKNKPNWLPGWLNVAVGLGAENMFGGFNNTFIKDNQTYIADVARFPRYRQYFLSFDIDLNRLPIKNKLVKTLLKGFNIIKIPAPTLEVNSLGQWKLHALYF